jgi:hypothetical protein
VILRFVSCLGTYSHVLTGRLVVNVDISRLQATYVEVFQNFPYEHHNTQLCMVYLHVGIEPRTSGI